MLGCERQRKCKVTQRHHNRHSQPQDIRASVLQDHDNKDVVEHVEEHVEGHVERGHVAIVLGHFGGLYHDGVDACVAFGSVFHVLFLGEGKVSDWMDGWDRLIGWMITLGS